MIRANAERKKNNVSLIEYIRNLIQSKAVARANADTTEDLVISMAKARAAALLLNVALSLVASAGIAFVISKINEARTKLETAANTAKENVDAANQVTSSLKELVSTYEELGDKSEWDTDDLEQAKDVQDQILDLLKDQDEAIQNKLGNLDLENGKYKEQLQILKDITLEQLKAANDSLKQQKDAQGALFQSEAEKQIGTGQYIVSDAENTAFAKELVDKFGGSFDENTGVLNLGLDTSTAEGAAAAYEKLGKILSYVTENYDDAERAQLGLYQTMLGDKSALQSQADAYNEVSKALEDNTVKIGQYTLSQDIATAKEKESASQEKSTQPTAEIDAKIKATKEYQDAVKEAQKTEEEWNSQGYGKYGNIDNFHRDKIDWTDDTLKQYKDFVAEQNDMEPGTVGKGGYSTVLGSWQFLSEYFDDADSEKIFAFTPMLQTDDGLVPLTQDQLRTYFSTIIEKATNNDGTVDIDKLMKLDATGLDEDINGIITHVKGMIAGVNGGKDKNGGTYSAADILAISGDSNEDIKKDLKKIYGSDADLTPIDEDGNLSRYIGKSMHDAQATAQQGKDNIEAVYNQLYDDLGNKSGENSNRLSSQLEDAFGDIAKSLGKDSEKLSISDVLGLTTDGIELTDEQATALDVLTQAADKYHTTIEGVAQASEENGLFGGAENAANNVLAAAKDMETLSQQIDNIQKAYKSCSTAVDEYNKYGYMSADALQSLLSMDYEYLNCMELVNGKLVLNNDAFAQMVASKYADAKVTAVQNAIAQIQAITQDSVKESTDGATEAMDDEVNKLNELSPGLGDAIKGTVGLATAQDLLNAVTEKQPVNPDRVQTILNGLNTQLSVIDSTIDTILSGSSKIKTHLNGFNKNNKSKSKSASKSVTDVASAFDTLTKAMKEYNQYGYISADTMKSMMKLEDKFTSCLVKNGDKLEINANEFRKLVETQLKQEEASGKASKSADELKRILSYLDSNVHSSTISFEQLTDVIKGYGTAMADAKEKTDAIKSAFSDLDEVGKSKISNPFGLLDADSVEKQYQAIRDLADGSELFTNADYAGALNPETGEIDYNSDAFKKIFLDRLDSMIAACKETGGAAGEYLAKGFEDARDKIAGNVISIEEYINGIGSTLSNINDRMDNFQSAFNDLADITKEYNIYGNLSQDSIQKFMALDPKYTACLEMQGDKLVFNKDAFRALYVAELQELALKYEGTDAGKVYADILQKVADGTWDVTDHMQGMGTEMENLKSALNELKDLFSSLFDLFEKFGSNKDNDLKLWGEAMTEHIDDQIEALNKQKEALEKANDEEERAITLAKLKAELEKARTQRTVRKYTSNGYEWVSDASAVKEAQDNLNDQQRTWRKEDAEKAIDDQIDKLNELKDKYSEIINLIGTSWDDYNKKLKYSAEIADMTFTEMEGRLDVFKGNVLGAMQSTKATSGIQDVISKLESLITTLEKINNLYSWAESGFTDYTDKGFNGLIKTAKKIFGSTGSDGKLNISISTGLKNIGQTVKDAFSGTSGNSITKAFQTGWEAISSGAKGLFSGSGANSLTTIFSNGLSGISDFIGSAFKGLGSTFASGGRTLVKAAGSVATKIGSALGIGGGVAAGGATAAGGGVAIAGASAIPVIGAIVAGVVNGINTNIRLIKDQKKIWSSDDKIGTKIVKSVGNTVWRYSPIGMIASTIQNISGFVKKIFGIESKKDKNNGTSSNGKIDVGSIVINSPDSPASNANSGTSGSDTGTTKQSFWDRIKNSKLWFWNWGKRAAGDKDIKYSGMYNVDEQGPELLVRHPASGRYTYLETGDGVVPADITSKLFEMGGNTDKWFADQLSKNGALKNGALNNIQNKTIGDTISVGDIYIHNPVGDTDALAREIVRDLPIKLRQQQGRR